MTTFLEAIIIGAGLGFGMAVAFGFSFGFGWLLYDAMKDKYGGN